MTPYNFHTLKKIKKIGIITGKYFPHNFKECLEMKKKIEFQVSKLFKNTTEQPVEKAHSADQVERVLFSDKL